MESLYKGDFIFNTFFIFFFFFYWIFFTIVILSDPMTPYICNHHIQGSPQISSRDIGYVLRILGQNPTEDEIVEMVMKVNNPIWCS